MRRLLYTGAFRYPDGDAAAHRVTSVASMFRDAGWEVTIAGWEGVEGAEPYIHQGFRCFPQGEFRSAPTDPLSRLAGFVNRGARTLRWLRDGPRPISSFDAIVAYNPPALFADRLRRMCERTGAAAVLDSTEWYEGSHLPGGRFGLAAAENWVRMRLAYPRYEHVICISRLLERHFAGRNVVRIPPLVGAVGPDDEARPDPSDGLRLTYAGQPGRKDRLGAVVRAIPHVAAGLGIPVRLVIAGVSLPELRDVCASERLDVAEVTSWTECLGRIDRSEVLSLYRRSHFSVLFREERRYAEAGFPTKAVESWSQGCPIICNPVGDLSHVAEDGMDALFVTERNLTSRLPDLLRQVVEHRRHPRMVAACLAKARALFTPEAYAAGVERFAARLPVREPVAAGSVGPGRTSR